MYNNNIALFLTYYIMVHNLPYISIFILYRNYILKKYIKIILSHTFIELNRYGPKFFLCYCFVTKCKNKLKINVVFIQNIIWLLQILTTLLKYYVVYVNRSNRFNR